MTPNPLPPTTARRDPVTPSTREVLMDTAELLFAERGVQGTTTREIVEAADQRNASAVTYHFGSREDLLLEILARRGAPVDAQRGQLRSQLGQDPSTDDLMRCLAAPYVALLASAGGRAYLRIVAQLRGQFAGWRVDSDAATTANLAGILDELECRPAGEPAVREARMLGMITLLTGLTAERAQLIDRARPPALAQDEFTETLVSMCTAVIEH